MKQAFTGLHKPLVASIGTANGDSVPFFLMMKTMMVAAGAGEIIRVKLAKTKSNVDEAKRILERADVVFFSGGEPKDGMHWLQHHNLVEYLQDMYKGGKRYVGVSAGAIMLGSEWIKREVKGDDNSYVLFDCLNIVPYFFDTHGEDEDWEDLRVGLRLMGDGAQAIGLPSNNAISGNSEGQLVNLQGEYIVFENRDGNINPV